MLDAQVQSLALAAEGALGSKVEGITFNGKPAIASLVEKIIVPIKSSKFVLLFMDVEVGSVTLIKDSDNEPWKFKKVA